MRAPAASADPASLAEALYQIRRCAAYLRGPGAILVLDAAKRADRELSDYLLALGADAGRTSEDADALKLRLVRSPLRDWSRVLTEDSAVAALLRAAEADGCDCRGLHVILGRVAEFRARWTYCREVRVDGRLVRAVMEDDPGLPVAPWLEAREEGVPEDDDLAAWADLYREWSRAAFTAAFPLLAPLRPG